MKLTKLNTKGIAHFLVPAVVVVAVAIGGSYLLVSSHADTVNLSASSDTNAATVRGSAILGVANSSAANYQSSVPYSFIGSQNDNFLGAGQSLTYNQGVKGNETSCYEVYVSQPKAGTATVTAEFTNNNNSVTKTLSSTSGDNLQQVCVKPGTQTNPGFSVSNLNSTSGTQQDSNLEVYQDVLTWN